MDTKQLRIHLRMLDAALEHVALLAELGREASEGTPDTFLFDNARKAIRRFRNLDDAMLALNEAALRDQGLHRYQCENCGEQFKAKAALRNHNCTPDARAKGVDALVKQGRVVLPKSRMPPPPTGHKRRPA